MDLYIEHIGACFLLTGKVSLILWSDCEEKGKGQNCEAETWIGSPELLVILCKYHCKCWCKKGNFQSNASVFSGSRVWEIFGNPNFYWNSEVEARKCNCQIIKISNVGIKNGMNKSVNYKKNPQIIRVVLCHTPDWSAGCYSYAKLKDWLSFLYCEIFFFFEESFNYIEIEITFLRERNARKKKSLDIIYFDDLICRSSFLLG